MLAFQLGISKRTIYSFPLDWSGLNFFLSKINSMLINLISDIPSRNKIKSLTLCKITFSKHL